MDTTEADDGTANRCVVKRVVKVTIKNSTESSSHSWISSMTAPPNGVQ